MSRRWHHIFSFNPSLDFMYFSWIGEDHWIGESVRCLTLPLFHGCGWFPFDICESSRPELSSCGDWVHLIIFGVLFFASYHIYNAFTGWGLSFEQEW